MRLISLIINKMSVHIGRLSKGQVAKVMTTGRSVHAPLFSFRYLAVREDDRKIGRKEPMKEGFSFVSPKKIFKTAVLRNRAKRRAREAFRAFLLRSFEGKEASLSMEGVFLLRSDVLKADMRDISDEMGHVFKKQGILN